MRNKKESFPKLSCFSRRGSRKKGELLNQVIIHIVLIGIVFAIFLMSTAGKINGRGVRQQVLEKEIALLIDSGVAGMSFEIEKENFNGFVSRVELKDGKVFVDIAGLGSFEGYPYFTKYDVSVIEKDDKFVVRIR